MAERGMALRFDGSNLNARVRGIVFHGAHQASE